MEDFTQSGLISIADGDYDTAIDFLNKSISKNDKDYKALLYRGIAYCNKGNFSSSINDFNNAEKLRNDEKDDFYYLRGKAYFYNQQLFEAQKDLEKAKSIEGIDEESKNKIEKLLKLSKE
jgi:tetratricopeptide (TPR) repeat protein